MVKLNRMWWVRSSCHFQIQFIFCYATWELHIKIRALVSLFYWGKWKNIFFSPPDGFLPLKRQRNKKVGRYKCHGHMMNGKKKGVYAAFSCMTLTFSCMTNVKYNNLAEIIELTILCYSQRASVFGTNSFFPLMHLCNLLRVASSSAIYELLLLQPCCHVVLAFSDYKVHWRSLVILVIHQSCQTFHVSSHRYTLNGPIPLQLLGYCSSCVMKDHIWHQI